MDEWMEAQAEKGKEKEKRVAIRGYQTHPFYTAQGMEILDQKGLKRSPKSYPNSLLCR